MLSAAHNGNCLLTDEILYLFININFWNELESIFLIVILTLYGACIITIFIFTIGENSFFKLII